MYAVRRIRDAFRENKSVKDPVEIQALVNKAKRDLEIIRRQVRWSRTDCFSSRTFSCDIPSLIGHHCFGVCDLHSGWWSTFLFLVHTCKMNYLVTRFSDILQEHTRTCFFWETELSCFAKVDAFSLRNWEKLLFNPSVFRMYSTWLCGIYQSINISSFFSSFSLGFKMNRSV